MLPTIFFCELGGNPLEALPCYMVRLLPEKRSLKPCLQQEELLKEMEESDEEQEEEEEKKRAKSNNKPPPTRMKHATVKSLWHLSGEAVLRNQLLPTGLLTPVPDLPFAWLVSSSSSLLDEEQEQNGTKEDQPEEEESVEVAKAGVLLPEEVKERMERLQSRCDVCEQLFLEEEAEEEGRGQARQIMRRFWDSETDMWWELLCCCQSCYNRPLAGCSVTTK
ncbi:hypothetical protein QOT17_021222 [Balamuthia mandrillaris]